MSWLRAVICVCVSSLKMIKIIEIEACLNSRNPNSVGNTAKQRLLDYGIIQISERTLKRNIQFILHESRSIDDQK